MYADTVQTSGRTAVPPVTANGEPNKWYMDSNSLLTTQSAFTLHISFTYSHTDGTAFNLVQSRTFQHADWINQELNPQSSDLWTIRSTS